MKKEVKKLKAYKVFNPDWTCNGFQYEVGKSYTIKEEPIMCQRGFHACVRVSDCFSYYSFNPKNKVAEVKLSGIILGEDTDKQCANEITILKEVKWEKMLILANTGAGNSGYWNSGDWNSGNRNSGDWNSGNWDSGDWNSGDWNSGNRNSGNRNSGNRNSGDWNSGNWDSGDWNSGYGNSGNRNSGNRNSGNWNSGNMNSGDWNSGNWDSGDWNSGDFNSITPKNILVFNKECNRKTWYNAPKPYFITEVHIELWIDWSEMSDLEKAENKNAFVTEGYLKHIDYKKAWAEAFKSASEKDINLLKALPNWDADVFEEITGLKIV